MDSHSGTTDLVRPGPQPSPTSFAVSTLLTGQRKRPSPGSLPGRESADVQTSRVLPQEHEDIAMMALLGLNQKRLRVDNDTGDDQTDAPHLSPSQLSTLTDTLNAATQRCDTEPSASTVKKEAEAETAVVRAATSPPPIAAVPAKRSSLKPIPEYHGKPPTLGREGHRLLRAAVMRERRSTLYEFQRGRANPTNHELCSLARVFDIDITEFTRRKTARQPRVEKLNIPMPLSQFTFSSMTPSMPPPPPPPPHHQHQHYHPNAFAPIPSFTRMQPPFYMPNVALTEALLRQLPPSAVPFGSRHPPQQHMFNPFSGIPQQHAMMFRGLADRQAGPSGFVRFEGFQNGGGRY